MDVEQEENQEVEVRHEDEQQEGGLAALKERAEQLNGYEEPETEDEPEAQAGQEEEPVASDKKPETTEQVASEVAEADAPAYSPNYKFVHKGQELEVDEFFKPLIKDADTEKKIHEISQKLAFVEDTKEIRQKWEQSQETLNMVSDLQRLYEEGVKENDMNKLERLVEGIGLTEQQIFDIARAKLERKKMDPEQQRLYENQRRAQVENERLMRENEQYQSQIQAESRRSVELQIENQLARPDVQELKGAYESIHGVGSFRELMINEGHAASLARGDTVPPSMVMEGIIKQYGPFLRQQTASHQPPTPQVNQQPKKVVTNVSSVGTSPSRSKVTSLDDIYKIREQRFGQD